LALAKAGFILAVKPVAALRPHEEIIHSHVEGLKADIMREGVQKDPIIIDHDTLTVLDGMHRLAAFQSLGCENAVCCSVEYSSSTVSLGRWARIYTLSGGDALSEALEVADLRRRVTLAQAFEALDDRQSGLAVLTENAAYLPETPLDMGQATDMVLALDRMSEERGWKRRFVPEDDIDVPLQTERNFVVLLRKLRKEDVVNAARSGKLFPCKTSMHVIDPRPVAVNFPVKELNEATGATLRKRLEGRTERLLPPGAEYEGRRYKERLLLLNQD